MTTLADLTSDAWTPVARRVPLGHEDTWLWSLSPHERGALYMAREAGRVITAQARVDGQFVLKARLAKQNQKGMQ